MQHRIHFWATGLGPARYLGPHVRLLTGFLLLSGTILSNSRDIVSQGIVAGACLAWLAMVRLPGKRILSILAYAVPVFVPAILLIWVVEGFSWAIAWQIGGKGLMALLIGIATMASLSVSEFHRALARLPVPEIVSAILIQTAHQTILLFEETVRVLGAIRVRAALGRGSVFSIARPLVQTWMPRVFFKADRVAAAMEVRGFAQHVPGFHVAGLRTLDRVVLSLAFLILGLLVARWFIG